MLGAIVFSSAIAYYFQFTLGTQEGFIVGGKFAKISDFPYSAYLLVIFDNDGFMCGASILNQKLLLTAAHCVDIRGRKYKLTVSVGNADHYKGVQYTVKDFLAHERYRTVSVENDVALLRVDVPMRLGPTVNRIVLMKRPPRDSYGYVAGWGSTQEIYESSSELLKYAKQRLWSYHQCSNELGPLPKGVICGGTMHGKNYAAAGDSGSALVIRNLVQVGLVSFKKPAVSKSLVVYTNVAYHYKWIVTNSKKLYCKKYM